MSVETESRPGRPRRWLVLLPLGIFLALAAVFLLRLWSGDDISRIPSVLVGSPAPKTTLPALTGAGVPGWDSSQFAGKVTLVNVFTWHGEFWAAWPLLFLGVTAAFIWSFGQGGAV